MVLLGASLGESLDPPSVLAATSGIPNTLSLARLEAAPPPGVLTEVLMAGADGAFVVSGGGENATGSAGSDVLVVVSVLGGVGAGLTGGVVAGCLSIADKSIGGMLTLVGGMVTPGFGGVWPLVCTTGRLGGVLVGAELSSMAGGCVPAVVVGSSLGAGVTGGMVGVLFASCVGEAGVPPSGLVGAGAVA